MEAIYKRLNDDIDFEEHIEDASDIQRFFVGQTVLLTGSTGFVGKALVEKMLRSCPDVKKIYFVVRPKKEPCDKRMKQYFVDSIFNRLKEEQPNYESKVAYVEGDLMKENMGISKEDRAILVEEVTIIYHNASIVKFDEKIEVALRANVLGTKYMLDLARECKRLSAFMYVSTAYSHCYMQHIDDKFYPPPVDMNVVHDILAASEASSVGVDEKAMQNLRGRWANNYVFTKSIAESLVEQCGKQVSFACSIYRPSIITSTYDEPIRGWCSNANGPVGLVIGCAVGFVHAVPRCCYPIDFTPIDMCVNALITATWDAVVNKETENEATVYNYGSSVWKPVTMREFTNKVLERGKEIGTMQVMGGYYVIYTRCIYQWWFLHVVTELLPAIFADFVLSLRGEKPKLFLMWKLVTKNARYLHHYVNGNWRIHTPRMQKVWDRLNKRDAKLFYSDLRTFNWDEYAYSYWAGIRTYMLKDPMETAPVAGLLFQRLNLIYRIIYYLGQVLILYFVARWLLPSFFSSLF